MKQLLQAVMLIAILAGTACGAYAQSDSSFLHKRQRMDKEDSLLIGVKPYIRFLNTIRYKNTGKYYYQPSSIEFVDSAGMVIKQIALPEEKTTETPFYFDKSKRMLNAPVQKSINVINNAKTFMAVNTVKTEIKDKAFYDSTDYYGIQRVDVVIYNDKGEVVFSRNNVSYHIISMTADGSKFCCYVPAPENYAGESFCPIRDYSSDAQLKKDGQVIVLDKTGKVLFQEYQYSTDGEGYSAGRFSSDGNWFLFLKSNYSGVLINLKSNKQVKLDQNLSDRTKKEFKAVTVSPIVKIDDNGNLFFEASFEKKRPIKILWIMYNPFTDKLTKDTLHRIVE